MSKSLPLRFSTLAASLVFASSAHHQTQGLLLDEPFGALDAKVRKELRCWLRRLHHDMNVTSVFVTYDQEEVLEVCDHPGELFRLRVRGRCHPL